MVPPQKFPIYEKKQLPGKPSWKMMGARVWLMKAVDACHTLTVVTTSLRKVTPACIISIFKTWHFPIGLK
jgi:hypothetical protein